MGTPLLTKSDVIMCPHGIPAQVVATNTRVTISGAPALVATDPIMVAGCPFTVGPAPAPCVTGKFMVPATRVTMNGVPAVTTTATPMVLATVPGPMAVVPNNMRVFGE